MINTMSQVKQMRRMMNNYTPSQLKEHLQWLYRQPNYYKEKKTFTHGGKREKILIYKYHEEWAKENGYRD